MVKTAKITEPAPETTSKTSARFVGGPLNGGHFPKNAKGPWRRALTPAGEPLTATDAISALVTAETAIGGIYLYRTLYVPAEDSWEHYYVHSGMNTAWSIIHSGE